MSISERIESTVERWRSTWGEALKSFLSTVVGFGIELILDIIAKKAAPTIAPILNKLEAESEIPPELKPMFDELRSPSGEWAAFLAQSAGGALVGGALNRVIDYILRPLTLGLSKAPLFDIPEPKELIALFLRGKVSPEDLKSWCNWLGVSDEHVEWYKDLAEVRFDPTTITALHWRDAEKYKAFWNDLVHQGFDPTRIDAIKELAKAIPPLSDMVRFADFSAFDPDVIAAWREFYNAPDWISKPMSLAGITNTEPRDWANKYWFSHWRQPGRFELGEIYRRGLLGKPTLGAGEVGGTETEGDAEATVKLAFKTMGYSSFWQDNLLQLVREVPTRVDVRRWWDMRTIDEPELRSIYQRQGYFGKDLENYVLWTKVYVAFPDLIARYKNGWITEENVRTELKTLGMGVARINEMIETKVKPVGAERVVKERELTKSEVYKAIKKGMMSPTQGIELIGDMGYSEAEAQLLVEINVGVLEGSPDTYLALKRLTQLYKQSQGLEAKIPSLELVQAEKDIIEAEQALKDVQTKTRDDITEADAKKVLETAKQAYLLLKSTPELPTQG